MRIQILLPGFEAGRAPTDRVFFAALPDADTAARILATGAALRAACALDARLHAAHALHVSLQHLGNHVGRPDALIDAALRAAARVRFPGFDVVLDRALRFGGRSRTPMRRAFVLLPARGAQQLCALDAAIAGALRGERIPARAVKFTPHVTLLYDARVVSERAVAPIYWRVRDFALVRRIIGAGRPYEILGRFPLYAAPDAASERVAAAERRGYSAARAGGGT